MCVVSELEKVNSQIRDLVRKRKELTAKAIEEYKTYAQYGGSKTLNVGEYKVVISSKVTTKIEKKYIDTHFGDLDVIPIRVKYELDKVAYKKWDSPDKGKFAGAISEKETINLTCEKAN